MNRIWLAIGILCFSVPTFLQMKDKTEQQSVIATYEQYVMACDEDELEVCFTNAKEYNEQLYELKESAVGDSIALDYESQLNVTKTGMMGHLTIPEISLPVGGKNSRAVLTGHCGLPNAELFTRLDELEVEDIFFLQICNQIMKYQVVEMQVVEPDQVNAIEIENDRDLVSLITCTPYGINTHRLIVTGERMEEVTEVDQEILEEDKGGVDEKICYIVGACFVGGIWIASRGIRRKH